jgi:beta-fructofuranosidase
VGNFAEHNRGISVSVINYAGSAFTDATGRPGLIHWLRGVDDPEGQWAGAHSVPHLLRLQGNVLIAEPHPNIGFRRGPAFQIGPEHNRHPVALPPVADLAWNPIADQACSLAVATGGTSILRLSIEDDELAVEIGDKTWRMPLGEHVRLVFDGPVVELFSSAGIFSAPIPVTGERIISVADSACTIHEL